MTLSRLLIGTRGSNLAVAQAKAVADALAQARTDLTCEMVHITTTGDRRRAEHLPTIGGKGLFTREIEQALLDGRIDLAVHSLKDLPIELPEDLTIAAIPERAPANDALISADRRPLAELPAGARVGTSSPRRAAQLLRARPDIRPVPIRGNLDTRIGKLRQGHFDAICVALAGLVRLGIEQQATEVLPFDVMLPAPGQGALAIEIGGKGVRDLLPERPSGCSAQKAPDTCSPPREQYTDDPAAAQAHAATRRWLIEAVSRIHHRPTALAARAERALLAALGGGCSLPLGACAEAAGPDTLRLRAILLTPDGKATAEADRAGPAADPAALAQAAAAALRRDGADAILAAIAGEP